MDSSRCPKCGAKFMVIDSRWCKDVKTVRRRRKCLECNYRFTTYEVPKDEYETMNQQLTEYKRIIDELEEIIERWKK